MTEIKTICCREVIVTGSTKRIAVLNALRTGISLAYADLRNLNFSGMNLKGIDFRYANLSGADLSWTSLRDANLQGARLCRTDLSWAFIEGTLVSEGGFEEANTRMLQGMCNIG